MEAVLFLEFTATEPIDTVLSAVNLSSGIFSGFSCPSLVTNDLWLLTKHLNAVRETLEGGQKTDILTAVGCVAPGKPFNLSGPSSARELRELGPL